MKDFEELVYTPAGEWRIGGLFVGSDEVVEAHESLRAQLETVTQRAEALYERRLPCQEAEVAQARYEKAEQANRALRERLAAWSDQLGIRVIAVLPIGTKPSPWLFYHATITHGDVAEIARYL
jgi:hypothetical protein